MTKNITLMDTTVRDGNQSNWGATGLDTGMMLQIAPTMERVGYESIDFISSTHMAVAVRFKQEDPWERIRLFKEKTPTTPLSFLATGMRFISWEAAHGRPALRQALPQGPRRAGDGGPCQDADARAQGRHR